MVLRSRYVVGGIALVSFGLVLAELPSETWLSLGTLSLGSGVTALALMATAALLGGRLKAVEAIFGGLDRVYRVHKWLAVWALVFASVHLLFKAGEEGWATATILELPRFWTRFVRQLSYVGLVGIVILALNRNIPYSQWRLWHKLSGPGFLVVVLHALSIKQPLELLTPVGVWLSALTVLGLGAAAYKLLLYPWLSPHAAFTVENVTRGAGAVHLELSPVGKGISFQPGQFAFLRLREPGLDEPHPFTIAGGGPDGGRLHFMIRALGDYTTKLVNEVRPGMRADVYLPYGRFRRPEGATREVWIAGGVGISPFVAWMTDPRAEGLDRATLFYFFTPGREFPSAEKLAAEARERGLAFVPIATGPSTPSFRQQFADIVREAGPEAVDVLVCGPAGLLDAIRALIREHGVPESRLRHELFSFR